MAFGIDSFYASTLNEIGKIEGIVHFKNDVYNNDGFDSSFSWSEEKLGICHDEKSAVSDIRRSDDKGLEDSFELFLREEKKATKEKWEDENNKQSKSLKTKRGFCFANVSVSKVNITSPECTGCECCRERKLLEDKLNSMMHRLHETWHELYSLRGRYKTVEDKLAESRIMLAEMNRYIEFIESNNGPSCSNEEQRLRNAVIKLQRDSEEKDMKLKEMVTLEDKFQRSCSEREYFQNQMIDLSRKLEMKAVECKKHIGHLEYNVDSFDHQTRSALKRPPPSEVKNSELTKRLKESESRISSLEKEKQDLSLRCDVLTEDCKLWKSKFFSNEKKLRDAKLHCQSVKSAGERLEEVLCTNVEDTPCELEKENKLLRNGISQMEKDLHRLMADISSMSTFESQEWQCKNGSSSVSKDDDTEKEKQRKIIIAPHTYHITSPGYVCLSGTPDASSIDRNIYENCELEETLEKNFSEEDT